MADLRMERVLLRRGCVAVGVDEAGRGPLAGPVVAGACILPPDVLLHGVNDSKQLSEKRREAAYNQIMAVAVGWGVGVVDNRRIDAINIRNATFEAMQLAVDAALAMARAKGALGPVGAPEGAAFGEALSGEPPSHDLQPFLLVDGNAAVPSWKAGQRTVVGGDRKVLSIAAGSILAKVTRDRMMVEYDKLYPQYGFAGHKGYGAKEHFAALEAHGPCPIHRITFIDHRQLRFF